MSKPNRDQAEQAVRTLIEWAVFDRYKSQGLFLIQLQKRTDLRIARLIKISL